MYGLLTEYANVFVKGILTFEKSSSIILFYYHYTWLKKIINKQKLSKATLQTIHGP